MNPTVRLVSPPRTDPVGPAGWSATNWLGFALQIGLFALFCVVIYLSIRNVDRGDDDELDGRGPAG